MRCFGNCATTQKSPDPAKHVLFSQGMVLGVDDFNQEFAYLANRDQWLARDLIGYGTVSGLAVGLESDATGPKVAVSPGVAVSPRGQLIRVKPKQCASLNEWLKKDAVKEQIPDGTSMLPVYVVLCYRDCPVDEVPILGEPCRTEEETMAASRLVDDFHLELRFTSPDQREEEGIRTFVAWVKQIEVADFSSTPDDLNQFVQTIEGLIPAAPQELSPPVGPLDFLFQSPPAELRIPAVEVCEYLRAAFRLWVTRLRPLVQLDWSAGCGCECSGCVEEKPANEACLLLAELELPLLPAGSDWVIDGARTVLKDESRRPWLLHVRMLQEWMLCGCDCANENGQALALGGDVTGPPANTTVEGIRNIAVDIAGLSDGQVLAYDSGINQWSPTDLPQPGQPATQPPVAENAFTPAGSNPALGTSPRFALEDHTHGVPPDPIPGHVRNVNSHANHNVAGDVTGTLAATVVARIRSVTVNPIAPSANQVLQFLGGQWTPATLPSASAPPTPGGAVTGEAAFDMAANAGSLTSSFARADHTHGTPPSPEAQGDAIGKANAATGIMPLTVQRIHSLPVDVPNAAQDVDKVLTFAGNKWTLEPGPTDVVTHPSGLPDFLLVAAGRVKGDGTATAPTYNNLRVVNAADGVVQVVFDGYVQPTTKRQYIVKVLPVFNEILGQQGNMLFVYFERFLKTNTADPNKSGFTLITFGRDGPIPKNILSELEFLIEVSQFLST